TPEKRAAVERLRKMGKTLLFSYAPGYLTPEGRSLESMNKLLGSNFKTFPGVFKNGKIVKTGENTYYSTDGRWNRKQVQKLLKNCGIHVYTENCEPVIYAGGNFITLHTKAGGMQCLTLPSEMEVEQCFPEKRSMGKSSVIKFNAPAKSTTIFYVR
ncbi:MAG: hypothetical protein IKD29_08645, partial [Lentisphaeria bacterium]|nr:hypothetical protein [Lentisphaeria bacterium]